MVLKRYLLKHKTEICYKMSKYTSQLNVKLSPELKADLEDVAAYQGIKPSELVRTWIRYEIMEVKGTRAFQNWQKKESV